MGTLQITPKNQEQFDAIKTVAKAMGLQVVEMNPEKEIKMPFAAISESTLRKEWDSKEDAIWDTLYAK